MRIQSSLLTLCAAFMLVMLTGCEDDPQGDLAVSFDFGNNGGANYYELANSRSVSIPLRVNISAENLVVEAEVVSVVPSEDLTSATDEPSEEDVALSARDGDPMTWVATFAYRGSYVIEFTVEEDAGGATVREGTGQVLIEVTNNALPLGPPADVEGDA
ncbi:MAG: hypothetical protein ACOCXA_05990 [Planctomycetota bacterium]